MVLQNHIFLYCFSGVVTSVSEDAFSSTNSDLLDLDSPRSNETLDSNEDSFTLSQDMAPNQGLDKHESWRNKISWQDEFGREMTDLSAFLAQDEDYHHDSSNTLSQYFTGLLARSQSKDVSKLDFSFSNDSDFLQFLHCSSSKTDVSIIMIIVDITCKYILAVKEIEIYEINHVKNNVT